ncbi:hypothetical protein ACTOV4_14250 [Brucella sp. C7-11G]
MAPLPKSFSIPAIPIRSAISEGRVEEAMQKLAQVLESGKADPAIQMLAAEWILTVGIKPGDAKALRNGAAALPSDWYDIAEMVNQLRDDGGTYAHAVAETANRFGYSERHVQKCYALWNQTDDRAD